MIWRELHLLCAQFVGSLLAQMWYLCVLSKAGPYRSLSMRVRTLTDKSDLLFKQTFILQFLHV